MKYHRLILSLLLFPAIATSITGCARTLQARPVKTAQFHENYSILHEGGKGQPLLCFWKDGIDWSDYSKVILAPVIIIKTPESNLNKTPHAERARLKELLDYRLRAALKKDFTLVRTPGPNVIKIEFAITEAETSTILLDTFSTFYPSARVLSGLKRLLTGTEFYVGEASIESRITDSETGTLLMAAVDRRAGGKTLTGAGNRWDDAEQAFVFWAQQLRYELCQQRQSASCQPPQS